MIIYRESKKGFVSDVFNGTIADEIDSAFVSHLGRHTSPNEALSWKNSMMHMYKVVNTPDIPDDSEIAIEYQIPLTSKRVDFIIAGQNKDKRDNIVIIELKQWESAKLTSKSGIVKTRFQFGESEVAHPSYQAWSYAETLYNFNETVRENDILLSPCAFLHNYNDDNVISHPQYKEYIDKAPLFLKSDAQRLQNFIKSRIKYGTKTGIVWMIENGKLKPSKQLADALCSMLKGNREFVLLDDQKVVYETAIEMAKKAQTGEKQVLVVEGGPGTGKSVVAINLLVNLTNMGIATQYVSKNVAPRDVYRTKLLANFRKSYINNLFTGSGCFIEAPRDTFGALVVDESHRLNEKSGLFNNKGENQIKEIIRASRFSVFFVDDRQKIHIKDIGSKKYIKELAEAEGANVYVTQLSSQFRCNGSDGYLSWIDNALQIRETANIRLAQEDFDFRVIATPSELFDIIKEKNRSNNKSRLVAGYCWDWNSQNNPHEFDIVFPEFGFKKQWNLKSSNTPWLIGEESIEQIGCIHTCQGLELDYVGVIVGDDLRYENNKVVSDVTKRSSNDRSVFGFGQMLRNNRERALAEADEIIKNTYRTLMTRGMKGCYVYFCDKALEAYFKSLLTIAETEEVIEDGIRIEPDVNEGAKFIDFLPLYTIRAACGYFGEGEDVAEEGWVRVEGLGRLNRNMYVVQAVGDSMEPLIQDGDYCVFRANPAGSREGKIILAQHHSKYDPDYSGSYSIKTYTSKKRFDSFGNWQHEEILLQPKNPDYNPIIINEDDSEDFRIVGEFVGKVQTL